MSQPASSRRVAIAYPMRPVPTQPSVLFLKSKSGIGSPLQTFARNGTGDAADMSSAREGPPHRPPRGGAPGAARAPPGGGGGGPPARVGQANDRLHPRHSHRHLG